MTQPSDGMVERMAKALAAVIIAEQAKQTPPITERPWEEWEPEHQDNMRKLARAAVPAMREPTEAMLSAVALRDWTGSNDMTRKDGWVVMIDAALSDGEAVVPHPTPAADEASGITKDQVIADLNRRLSLSQERLPHTSEIAADARKLDAVRGYLADDVVCGDYRSIPPTADWP